MALCLDASAAVEGLLAFPLAADIRRFLNEEIGSGGRIVAPPLLFAEVTNVLRRHVHLGAFSHQDAVAALRDLFDLPIAIVHQPRLYLRALDLAQRLGHSRAYDVQYLAVAEMEDCPVITLDRRLHEDARRLGIAARLLP